MLTVNSSVMLADGQHLQSSSANQKDRYLQQRSFAQFDVYKGHHRFLSNWAG